MRTYLKIMASVASVLIVCVGVARADFLVSNLLSLDEAAGVISPNVPLATSFTTGEESNWRLDFVRIVAFRVQSGGYESLYLALHADDNGRPGQVIAEIDSASELPVQPSLIDFTSAAPIDLEAETKYWLVLRKTGLESMVVVRGTYSTDELSSHGWTIGDGTIASNQEGGWTPAHFIAGIEVYGERVPFPPEVISVSGCFDAGEVTLDCPTQGGALILVTGRNFTVRTRVLIGGFPPQAQEFVSSTEILCTLAPGVRAGLPLTVIDEGGITLLADAVSYEESRCYGDADFNGNVNFEDIVETLAHWSVTCE